jgi:hypothetical protein
VCRDPKSIQIYPYTLVIVSELDDVYYFSNVHIICRVSSGYSQLILYLERYLMYVCMVPL